MNIKGKESVLVYIMGILWVVVLALAAMSALIKPLKNMWYPALFVLLVLMFVLLVMGSIHNGKVSKGFLLFPVLTWVVVMAVCFILAQYYAIKFDGKLPTFAPLGLHPSFFWIIVLFWFVGTLVIMLGFYYRSELWLSQAEWDTFIKEISTMPAGAPLISEKNQVKSKITPKAKSKSTSSKKTSQTKTKTSAKSKSKAKKK